MNTPAVISHHIDVPVTLVSLCYSENDLTEVLFLHINHIIGEILSGERGNVA